MQVLVLLSHPRPDSLTAALAAAACDGLRAAGHDVTLRDLCAEAFDPVATAADLAGTEGPQNPALAAHAADLMRAEALILVHPVWWSGPPAVLKGWIDRVLRPGLAYDPPPPGGLRIRGRLQRIRTLGIIATAGAPRWTRLLGDPHGTALRRTFGPLIHPRARWIRLQLDAIDRTTPATRARFIARVRDRMARL